MTEPRGPTKRLLRFAVSSALVTPVVLGSGCEEPQRTSNPGPVKTEELHVNPGPTDPSPTAAPEPKPTETTTPEKPRPIKTNPGPTGPPPAPTPKPSPTSDRPPKLVNPGPNRPEQPKPAPEEN